MFTMTQVDELHDRLGRAESLADYLRGLAAIGVVRVESFVADGHSEYFSADGQQLASPPHHEVFAVAEHGERDLLAQHLRRHAAGGTSYAQMSAGLASSGVEKWVADTSALTMTYRDRAGVALLVENIT